MKIEGLKTIQAPVDVTRQPGQLTPEEVAGIMPFFGRGGDSSSVRNSAEGLGEETVMALLDIQDRCQFLANRGWNNKRTGLEDFDIAIVDTDPDGDGRSATPFADVGDVLVVRHRKTKRAGHFDLIYPGGFRSGGWANGAYSTGNALVRMGL